MKEIILYSFWMLGITLWSMKRDSTKSQIYFRYITSFIGFTAGMLIARGIQ